MPDQTWGVVVFGDVVRSRDRAATSTRWLEGLCSRLDATYDGLRLASFEFTQGDELQGLLAPEADPFIAVLDATLRTHDGPSGVPRMRWALAAGPVDPGRGPATRRTGPAFLLARQTLDDARRLKEGLLCRTGDPAADTLLDGTAPVLAAIIDDMTDRQREVARLALVEGLRQADIADRLRVARPTVSVSFARGDVLNLARLSGAVRTIWATGVARARVDATLASADASGTSGT